MTESARDRMISGAAQLLSRAGDRDAARAAYDQAIAACRNDVERDFLLRRREELGAGS